ncbi:MAG: diacylglycerol kinase [Thermodesulfobacteriota bacterium]
MPSKNHWSVLSLERLALALGYSWSGLKAAFVHEAAFRQEILLLAVLAPVALLVDTTLVNRALLLASLLAVLVVELLNSAIEALTDKVAPDLHPLAKRAKDMGSAAVLVALLAAAGVWLAVLAGP